MSKGSIQTVGLYGGEGYGVSCGNIVNGDGEWLRLDYGIRGLLIMYSGLRHNCLLQYMDTAFGLLILPPRYLCRVKSSTSLSPKASE